MLSLIGYVRSKLTDTHTSLTLSGVLRAPLLHLGYGKLTG
jgi:hypothetical protein